MLCTITMCATVENFLTESALVNKRKCRNFYFLIEDKSDDSDACMETSPRNSLSPCCLVGMSKASYHSITGF